MPYQRSGRDYGPGSIGGTTKYSSRKQVSIGVPDYNAKKKARKPAPKPVQPAKKDPGVAGVPGGLTGRGQNNPALTDPGVMGVPGGVTGRQAPVTRQKQPSAGSDSTLGFGPMQPTRMDPYLSFSGTPNTQQQRERSTPVTGQPGGSTPTNTSTGLSFNGPVNGIPWSSGHLPLASSSLTNLTLGSLEPQSPPLTAEEQQELEYFRQKREAFRRGETIARNAWELNTAPPKTAAAPKQGGLKKGPASNASPELYGTQGDSIFDLGMNRAHTDTLQPQISPQDLHVFERELKREMTRGAADKTPSFSNLGPSISINPWDMPSEATTPRRSQSNAIIGTGMVDYGSAPGGAEAIAYQELMRSLGNVNVQDYASQQEMHSPFYEPPKPSDWRREKIEVRYNTARLGTVPLYGWYHSYIVYTDKNGDQHIIRGGPVFTPENLLPRSESPFDDGPVPDSHVERRRQTRAFSRQNARSILSLGGIAEEFDADHVDWKENYGSEVIKQGGDLSQHWEIMENKVKEITDSNTPYRGFSNSSNTLVDEVLRAAGLPLPQLDDPGEYHAPGSLREEPFDVRPPRRRSPSS